jgi:hypothetical protein
MPPTFNFKELIENNPKGTERLLRDVLYGIEEKPGMFESWSNAILFLFCCVLAVLVGLEIIFPKQVFQVFEWIARFF